LLQNKNKKQNRLITAKVFHKPPCSCTLSPPVS